MTPGGRPGDEPADELTPWQVLARIEFGPLSLNQLIPMRLNGGDVVVVRPQAFQAAGVALAVMGVGSGGLAAGDGLLGLQMFYA